jgi:hypothetical protein
MTSDGRSGNGPICFVFLLLLEKGASTGCELCLPERQNKLVRNLYAAGEATVGNPPCGVDQGTKGHPYVVTIN